MHEVILNTKKIIAKLFNFIACQMQIVGLKIYQPPRNEADDRVIPWNNVMGDQTLRLNYDLNADSIIIDVGGYEGQWASDIFGKYLSQIYIFEPIEVFADGIKQRFEKNERLHIFPVGLGAKTRSQNISLNKNESSLFKTNGLLQKIQIVAAVDFFHKLSLHSIDLIKINIEGGEYELLEHFIATGFIKNIKNIQVQFHDFIENAESRMENVQKSLSLTHKLTYQYPFVWENWELK